MFKQQKKTWHILRSSSLSRNVTLRLQVVQRRWADWMQARTRHWQTKQQKRFLFILCLVMGGCSTHGLLQLFNHSPEVVKSSGFTTPSPLPPLVYSTPDPTMPTVIDTAIFRRFRQHLDSLLKTPGGKEKYELFVKQRPGFMDSLAFAEQLLQQSFPHH